MSLLLVLFLSSCTVTQRFPDFHNREIHHFKMVKIGGMKQAILINGQHSDNPVLLFLHGGPGFPMLPFEPFTETMKRLEEQYTIVYWEQRGTGKSYRNGMSKERMNIAQFVSDTREVVDYVRDLLEVEKVFLWGHSWGSNVGALYAAEYPETLHAYISTGQSVNPFQNEMLAYEFVKEKATREGNRRALRQLARMDTVPQNYSLKHALTLRKWVYRYGGIVHQNLDERPYVDFGEIITILTSPVYPLRVRINLLINPYFSAEKLWNELKSIDLIAQAPRIEVPVFFLVGRHDIIVSHVLAEKYFKMLDAPKGKEIFWFENSAHRPFDEEQEQFISLMKNTIIDQTREGITTR